MKKIILSTLVLLLSFTSLLALEPVTETYTSGYPSLATDANTGKPETYDWSVSYSAPVTVTWSAEPLSEMGSDGFPHYQVTVTIANEPSLDYYNWALGFVRSDDFVACDAPLQKIAFVTLENRFGNSPAGTFKLTLHKDAKAFPPYGLYSLSAKQSEIIKYEAEIKNGSTVITPPDQIIFGASYLDGSSAKGLAFAIQRDHPDQASAVAAVQ